MLVAALETEVAEYLETDPQLAELRRGARTPDGPKLVRLEHEPWESTICIANGRVAFPAFARSPV